MHGFVRVVPSEAHLFKEKMCPPIKVCGEDHQLPLVDSCQIGGAGVKNSVSYPPQGPVGVKCPISCPPLHAQQLEGVQKNSVTRSSADFGPYVPQKKVGCPLVDPEKYQCGFSKPESQNVCRKLIGVPRDSQLEASTHDLGFGRTYVAMSKSNIGDFALEAQVGFENYTPTLKSVGEETFRSHGVLNHRGSSPPACELGHTGPPVETQDPPPSTKKTNSKWGRERTGDQYALCSGIGAYTLTEAFGGHGRGIEEQDPGSTSSEAATN